MFNGLSNSPTLSAFYFKGHKPSRWSPTLQVSTVCTAVMLGVFFGAEQGWTVEDTCTAVQLQTMLRYKTGSMRKLRCHST